MINVPVPVASSLEGNKATGDKYLLLMPQPIHGQLFSDREGLGRGQKVWAPATTGQLWACPVCMDSSNDF